MTLAPHVAQLAVAALILLLGPAIAIAVRILHATRAGAGPQAGRSRWMRILIPLLVMAFAVLLLRPHEHVFQGLDSSAYRLMACALSEGKPLKGKDLLLIEIPPEMRRGVLLESTLNGRLTRDRSCQILSLDAATTQPYFYPTLSLCMVGFDLFCPGTARDLFVPAVALLLLALSFRVAVSRGGGAGLAPVVAAFLGTPLLVWTCRGGFAETAAALFLAIAVLGWLVTGATVAESFLMGVALAIHPSLLVLAVPLVGVMAFTAGSTRRRLSGVLAFGAGCLPLVGLTLWVAQPYGGLRWADQWRQLQLQPMSAAVYLAAALSAVLFAVACCFRRRLGRCWTSLVESSPFGAWALIAFAVALPWVLLGGLWSQRGLMGWGARDFATAFPWPFALALTAWLLVAVLRYGDSRSRALLLLLLAALPVFLVLKGYERFGFWSQRRLTPPLMLLLPLSAWTGSRVAAWSRRCPLSAWGVAALLMLASAYTIVRWPAPYWMREEAGADALLAEMRARVGSALVVSDYYPFSVPLAALPGSRSIGLNTQATQAFGATWRWIHSRIAEEPVYWLSTQPTHPGLESGVRLIDRGHLRARLPLLHSRAALPALPGTRDIAMAFLQPVALSDDAVPPTLDKTIVHGPLALRGPWEQRQTRCRSVAGEVLATRWTREGSGLIGPVPPPGGSLQIECLGASGRQHGDPVALRIQPPWQRESIELRVQATARWSTNVLTRPLSSELSGAPPTGLYTLTCATPYDPATDGIEGFPADLGVQLHRIRLIARP